MTRFRFLFVTVTVLSCAASLSLTYVPRVPKWLLYADIGCALTVIVFVLSALLGRMWNALATFSMLLVVLLVGDSAIFAYRTNNICAPQDHILQSDADAIEVAKERVSKKSYYGRWQTISGVDVREAMNLMEDCCGATKSRNWDGVIVWQISMFANRGADGIFVQMKLSNCGEMFHDTHFSTVEPIKR
jgi:hypothetical protein